MKMSKEISIFLTRKNNNLTKDFNDDVIFGVLNPKKTSQLSLVIIPCISSSSTSGLTNKAAYSALIITALCIKAAIRDKSLTAAISA
jgi:hypothetical protein